MTNYIDPRPSNTLSNPPFVQGGRRRSFPYVPHAHMERDGSVGSMSIVVRGSFDHRNAEDDGNKTLPSRSN
eukprot:scaffold221_cov351-Pavlova_lutheri.AAC.13